MGTIMDEAKAYEPPQTRNISDLTNISTKVDIVEKEYSKEDGSTFKIKVVEIDGEDYRVPTSVLKALKEILIEKPDLKSFKVSKSGEGLKTTYTVITLD
ncbi:MAG: hypothetical protein IH845_05365 [Nanoarchaeota archaeon]|nr:hypothetical protein [Nanoarchaeota archaeon]